MGPDVREGSYFIYVLNSQALKSCCGGKGHDKSVLKAYLNLLHLCESEILNIGVLSLFKHVSRNFGRYPKESFFFLQDDFPNWSSSDLLLEKKI